MSWNRIASDLKSQIADCEAQFRRVLKARADKLEWRSALDWPNDFVARNARAADLVITGGGIASADSTRQINSGDLVLRAGRPVLVVPPQADWLKLKAWSSPGRTPARRAVPSTTRCRCCTRAQQVIVVRMAPSRLPIKPRPRLASRTLPAGSYRRGISASYGGATKALIGVTGRLDILAQDEGAGIIVAGAYGHSRFQGVVFRRVTPRPADLAEVLCPAEPLSAGRLLGRLALLDIVIR